jgi:uncharacterized protein (TIGR04552 family)
MSKTESPAQGTPSMIVRLSPGDLERARLVLRGGSVLDWRRLQVTSIKECDEILRVNGFHPEEPGDASLLRSIHLRAMDYLERNFGFTFTPEIMDAPATSSLMLLAAGSDTMLRRQACMVLKVMHVVHHVEARELKARLNISDRELYHLIENKVASVIQEMRDQGYPIIGLQSSHKSQDSIFTKLLSKRQGNRAFLYDIIRFRIITATIEEIVPVVAYLSHRLFPFHYTVTGESHNSIFDFKDFIRRHPHISRMAPEFQVDLMYGNEMSGSSNPETSHTFKTAKFTIDLPIRLDDSQLGIWAPGLDLPSRIVHVLAEFQIVDQASNVQNEQGDASHDMYKARRLARVKERLLSGKIAWSGKDSE